MYGLVVGDESYANIRFVFSRFYGQIWQNSLFQVLANELHKPVLNLNVHRVSIAIIL